MLKKDYSFGKTILKGLGMAVVFFLAILTSQFPHILEFGLRDGIDWVFARFPVLDTITIGFLFGMIRNFVSFNWVKK